jgi:hypothetical protein
MTDEVGVVTGPLTLRSELDPAGGVGGAGNKRDGHQMTLRVQYKDADEWYTVTGGRCTLADAADLEAVHAIAVALLNRPSG